MHNLRHAVIVKLRQTTASKAFQKSEFRLYDPCHLGYSSHCD